MCFRGSGEGRSALAAEVGEGPGDGALSTVSRAAEGLAGRLLRPLGSPMGETSEQQVMRDAGQGQQAEGRCLGMWGGLQVREGSSRDRRG